MDHPLRPPLTRKLTLRHLVAVDVLLGGLLTALALSLRGASRTALPLALAAAGAVALRRLAPVPALGVALTAAVLSTFGPFPGVAAIATALTAYLVAVAAPARTAGAVLAVSLAVLAATALLWHPARVHRHLGPGFLVETGIELTAAWAVGWAVARGREYSEGLRRESEQRAAAERDRARHTVTEERLRIARELHDVVAHSMSVIAVQAGVGRHVIGSRPEEAERALGVIEDASRSALQEMRALLGMLRDGGPAELLPGGLADLPTLLQQTGEAGVAVELTVRGAPARLSPAADLAAFRTVQEALTNVVKHARTDRAEVLIDHRAAELLIRVRDDGAGRPGEPTAGHGLVGIRERAALHGGSMAAAGRPAGGFELAVRLPLPAAGARDRAAAAERGTAVER